MTVISTAPSQKSEATPSPSVAYPKKVSSFRDLAIWKKSMNLALDVYTVSKDFPREELYGLRAQIRKSAVSIPSNIAEGFKRWHKKEFKQFLHIALGSLAELETQIMLATSFQYITQNEKEKLTSEILVCDKMISKLASKYQD